jgi:hypothetical protein
MLQKLSKVPKMEPANPLLKAPQALKKSFNSEFMNTTIKNLNQELDAHK